MSALNTYTGAAHTQVKKATTAMANPKVWADAFRSVVNSAIRLKNHVKKDFFSSLLTVVLALFVYGGWHVVNQGGVESGFKSAFVWTAESRRAAGKQSMAAQLQTEIRLTQQANKLILGRLNRLVAETPGASRSRVHVIHNGVFTVTGTGLLRYSITHAAARAGRSPGPYESDTPLSQMADYLDTLFDKGCKLIDVSVLREPGAVAKHRELGVARFLACPITNTANQILGALVTQWDAGDAAPDDMRAVLALHHEMAAQIAIALELKALVE